MTNLNVVREAIEVLERFRDSAPAAAERLGAALQEELEVPPREMEMATNEVQMSLRLPEDLVKRLERMEARMAKDPELAPFRVSRQSVLRMALMRGLDALEDEHGTKKTGR